MSNEIIDSQSTESRRLTQCTWFVLGVAATALFASKLPSVVRNSPMPVFFALLVLMFAVSLAGIILSLGIWSLHRRLPNQSDPFDATEILHIVAGVSVFQIMAIAIWRTLGHIILHHVV